MNRPNGLNILNKRVNTMNNKSYVGVVIADVHGGAFKAEDLMYELDESLIKYLKSLKILDFVVIAGDLFDNKLSLNSSHTKYLFVFLKKLMEICLKHNAKLRIIKGTEFHDNKQLDILKFLGNTNCDIKIFETVAEEELFEDFNVLYVPEEYITDKDEYYKEYFSESDKYDMIFGHGLLAEVAFVAKMQESEVTMSKAPIFKSDTLLDICKGPIFFGHVHKSQCIKNRIFYVGSFSRWIFGEEEPKGFFTVGYTPNTSNYDIEFIENKHAKKYDTMIIDYNSAFYRNDENQQIDYIINLVNNIKVDRLRIIFNIPEDYPNPTLLTNLINDIFAKYKHIKIIINNNSKDKIKKREMENKIKTLLSTYDFIFDKAVPTEEKLSKFIKIKFNKNIPYDVMRDYLYQKINL